MIVITTCAFSSLCRIYLNNVGINDHQICYVDLQRDLNRKRPGSQWREVSLPYKSGSKSSAWKSSSKSCGTLWAVAPYLASLTNCLSMNVTGYRNTSTGRARLFSRHLLKKLRP